ncbi:CMP-N-acetylneuraminate-beta-1,4-galactoside alpha-2,3-sialyltransferase [Caenorhabditis elegans]|nr:CMP-N-acetylneuraminate-beta-1,4-galactoside alpha-2,3-sialyltransferase [Caenorhabditis elegans]CBX53344.1 CMP-N-acetylneuraminate-beta-1,4-galactoside alpha-2,3-sialyltransferase [Caenorhabditis elegans]|eukprot:NP_001256712.1 Uncharacterized protein CELE_Y32B12B.1 [Caenorhabditis elegans]
MARVLLAGAMILISLFLLISFGNYLYELYGPEPEKKVETFDSVQREKEPKSELSRFISAKHVFSARPFGVICANTVTRKCRHFCTRCGEILLGEFKYFFPPFLKFFEALVELNTRAKYTIHAVFRFIGDSWEIFLGQR